MTLLSLSPSSHFRAACFTGLLLLAMLVSSTTVFGADLVPRTKIRVSLVQWMPTAGQYQSWNALGGDYEVDGNDTVQLPIVGAISVAGKTTTTLADEIARKVKEKTGLVSVPNATVQIISYPPIYIVGDVAKPGEYPYHEGQTVLQALAAGGGMYRAATDATSASVVKLASTIQQTDDELLRTRARIARMKAELAGATTIDFPALPKDQELRQRASGIFDQENLIFTSRAKGLDRQIASLNDLQTLFTAEIDTLQQKVAMTDQQIKSTQKELSGVKMLVKKGIAVASHQNDLEAQLANYQASRLDNLTAIMRARQSITEAKRNLQALEDNSKTEVATQLQQAQETLDNLLLQRQTSQTLLIDGLANGTAATRANTAVTYLIVRREDGHLRTIHADEASDVQPGDVLKIVEQAASDGSKEQPSPNSPAAADMKGAKLSSSSAQEHGT